MFVRKDEGPYVSTAMNTLGKSFQDVKTAFDTRILDLEKMAARLNSSKARFYMLQGIKCTPSPYCYYCGVFRDGIPMVDEHVFPLSIGGLDDPSNIVKACNSCNTVKGPMTPDGMRLYLSRIIECEIEDLAFFHELYSGEEIEGKMA